MPVVRANLISPNRSSEPVSWDFHNSSSIPLHAGGLIVEIRRECSAKIPPPPLKLRAKFETNCGRNAAMGREPATRAPSTNISVAISRSHQLHTIRVKIAGLACNLPRLLIFHLASMQPFAPRLFFWPVNLREKRPTGACEKLHVVRYTNCTAATQKTWRNTRLCSSYSSSPGIVTISRMIPGVLNLS